MDKKVNHLEDFFSRNNFNFKLFLNLRIIFSIFFFKIFLGKETILAIDASVMKKLHQINYWDIKLYRFAQKVIYRSFLSRISSIVSLSA